jgi:hypothetical protein
MIDIFSKELVPLYTALAWIVFWTGLLVFARKHLSAVFDAVASRVRAGSILTVGPVTIGEPPRELKDAAPGAAVVSNTRDPDAIPAELTVDVINREYKRLIDQQYFLLHAAEITRERTSPRSGRYRVRVWLESYYDISLADIIRVTYRIWDDARRPIISTTSEKTNFDLWLTVYGEFPVLAYVERRGKSGVWLTRYLDLPGRPSD